MITKVNQLQYTPSFTAKAPQIRDAEWVCRVINHTFPHYSTSKHQVRIINLLKRNKNEIKYDTNPKTLGDIYNTISKYITKNPDSKLAKQLKNIIDILATYGIKRMTTNSLFGIGNLVYESLYLMEKYKFGNCSECAIIAELVLKMNGIKNACCASLKKGLKEMSLNDSTPLDHLICILNKNGTPFTGKITKETIILDPWLNKAGFAKDMERFYRNEFSHFFELDPNEVFKYEKKEFVNIEDFDMTKLQKKYHPFIFKNKSRKFMQGTNNKK